MVSRDGWIGGEGGREGGKGEMTMRGRRQWHIRCSHFVLPKCHAQTAHTMSLEHWLMINDSILPSSSSTTRLRRLPLGYVNLHGDDSVSSSTKVQNLWQSATLSLAARGREALAMGARARPRSVHAVSWLHIIRAMSEAPTVKGKVQKRKRNEGSVRGKNREYGKETIFMQSSKRTHGM